jgi:ribosomal protein S30
MAKLHGKSKQTPNALGKERKETRQERRNRLEKEYEARQVRAQRIWLL